MSLIKKLKEAVRKNTPDHMARIHKENKRRLALHEQGIHVHATTKWLELREKDKYVYMHSPWCNGEAVVILPFRKKGEEMEYLAVMEKRPCHTAGIDMYSVTGGCDKEGELPIKTAMREVQEETGYKVKVSDMIPLGTLRDCKASDMLMYAFAVEIKEDTSYEDPQGDGSAGEENAFPIWTSEIGAVWESPDPMLSMLILRLRNKDKRS